MLTAHLSLVWYGTGCGAAVGSANASSPSAVLKGEGRLGAVGTATASSPLARVSDGRRMAATATATATSPSATLKGNGRMGAIGKVNALSQDDVTGAVLEAKVEGPLSLKQAIRLLLAVSQGNATGLDAAPAFKSLDGSKTRVAGTVSGGNRTITTRDAS